MKIVYSIIVILNLVLLFLFKNIFLFKNSTKGFWTLVSCYFLNLLLLACFSYFLGKKTSMHFKSKKVSNPQKYMLYLWWALVPCSFGLFVVRIVFSNTVNLKKDFQISIMLALILSGLTYFKIGNRFIAYNNVLSPSFSYTIESAISANMILKLKSSRGDDNFNCSDSISCVREEANFILVKKKFSRSLYPVLVALSASRIFKDDKYSKLQKDKNLLDVNMRLLNLYKASKPFHAPSLSFGVLSPIASIEILLVQVVDFLISNRFFLLFLTSQDKLITEAEEKKNELVDINLYRDKLDAFSSKNRLGSRKKVLQLFDQYF